MIIPRLIYVIIERAMLIVMISLALALAAPIIVWGWIFGD